MLADRHSRRLIAAGGAPGYAAGLFLFAAGTNVPMLVVAVRVMGFAGDAMIRATDVALVDVAGDRLELAVARATLLGTIGDLAGPGLAGSVPDHRPGLAGVRGRVDSGWRATACCSRASRCPPRPGRTSPGTATPGAPGDRRRAP